MIDWFSFRVRDRQVLLKGTVHRFSCKIQFIDRISFKVVDIDVLLQGTVDRFSCKVQLIDSLARYS